MKKVIVVTDVEQGWDCIVGVFDSEEAVFEHLNEEGDYKNYEELKGKMGEECYFFFDEKVKTTEEPK